MFIEIIDTLRCPEDHRDSWLVASITGRDERLVREGLLGCPVCGREYPIARGIAWFGAVPGETTDVSEAAEPGGADEEGAMHVGAFLAPAEGSTIALEGCWAASAAALVALMPLRIIAVNPGAALEDTERVAAVETRLGLPFAPRSVGGVALGETATGADLASAVRVLADAGRLVAPVTLDVPAELRELARDEHWWVGEKRGALIGLRRA